MGFLVVATAQMMCSFGSAPGVLTVVRPNITADKKPAANIMDYKPAVNVAPFGTCQTVSNPAVAAATTAALGVLTPQPCVPNTVAPWAPGATKVVLDKAPALHDGCMLNCLWGGVIKINVAGQVKVQVK